MALTKVTGEGVGTLTSGISGTDITLSGGVNIFNSSTDSIDIRATGNRCEIDNPDNNSILLKTGGTTRIRIDPNGLLFGSDTAAANALDDYEEGTWTPTLTASSTNPTVSYISNNGKYTKIGNVCHASFQMRVSSHSSGSGTYQVSGLPFASVTANSDHVGVSTAGLESHPIGSTEQLIQVIDHNTSHIRMLKAQNNAGWAPYTPASGVAIYMSFTYPVG